MPISEYLRSLRDRVGTELVLMPSVVAIVRDGEGRVLLQRRADDGEWGLPAGAVDPGETPAQAVMRETLEETGLVVVPQRIAGVLGGPECRFTYPNGDVVEYTAIVFDCRVNGGTLQPVDDETLELGWFAVSDFPPMKENYPRQLFEPGETVFQMPAV